MAMRIAQVAPFQGPAAIPSFLCDPSFPKLPRFGIVVFVGVDGEIAEPELLRSFYSEMPAQLTTSEALAPRFAR